MESAWQTQEQYRWRTEQETPGVLKSIPVTLFTGMDSENVYENTFKYNKVPELGEI